LSKICGEGQRFHVLVFVFVIGIFYESGDFQGPEDRRDGEGAQPGKEQSTASFRD
jgi:hypothetical protein